MARTALTSAFLVVAVVAAGCGPARQYPSAPQKDETPAEQGQAVPTSSEPAAKAVVDRAVKACTGGKPELLAKGKVSRAAAKGIMILPGGDQQTRESFEAMRKLQAVWPDRLRVAYELKNQANQTSAKTIWLRRPAIDVSRDNEPVTVSAGFEKVVAADVIGQHWLLLVFPLNDPKAVVFDLKTMPIQLPLGGKPMVVEANVLKVAFPEIPDIPVYQVAIDAKTDLLIGVEYVNSEIGLRMRHGLVLADHKPTGGLLLPTRIEYSRNGEPVERWEVEGWEFPASIDDSEFSPPKVSPGK